MTESESMKISRYQPDDENSVLEAIKLDSNWDILTNDKVINSYKNSLRTSITYVCHNEREFTGYIRAIQDDEIAIFVSELYVVPKWRNRKIGKALIEQIKEDFPEITVYALSDEDVYYEKLGFRKIGSVFLVQ